MADILNADGLQIKSLSDLVTELETGLKSIYGSDINVTSSSPDGQMINIIAQGGIDIRELIQSVYNSFDPDATVGTVLDQRIVINNITRAGGTYTIVPIDVETNASVELQGLDADFNNPDGTGYTIQDDAGNEFILIDTYTFTAGTTTKNFRAKNIGAVEVTGSTIQTPVTIINGVVSVDNTSGVLQTGTDQETDVSLKIRRSESLANSSFGYLNGLQGVLLALDGVTEAKVYENKTNSVDGDGIPAHGIWAIVEGGANSDIGAAIESRLNPGANMKGDVTVYITTPAGVSQPYSFDRPVAEDLYIQFDIQTTIVGSTFDQAAIKTYIETYLVYTIGQFAETSDVTAICREAIDANGGGGVPVNVEISANGSDWYDYLTTSVKNGQFTVSDSNITITEL